MMHTAPVPPSIAPLPHPKPRLPSSHLPLASPLQDDVKHLRLIIGLNSPTAREQLTRSTLLAMTAEQQEHFDSTLDRISSNLSVQRNARDLELYTKVLEVRGYLDSYSNGYGGGGMGEFGQM